jgi:hypothetical protein
MSTFQTTEFKGSVMTDKQLAETRAYIMLAYPQAGKHPQRILNEQGADRIAMWLAATAKRPCDQNEAVWCAKAWEKANDDPAWDQAIIIEMAANMTASGRAEILELPAADFDWITP